MKKRQYHIASLILIFPLLLLSSNSILAQSQYRFQHFNTDDGLASEFAHSIAQDSLGYLWVQFYGGLSRFDGYSFKIYKHDPTDSARALLTSWLGKLEDANRFGEIWIPVHHRNKSDPYYLTRYIPETDGFVKYNLGLRDVTVSRVQFDGDRQTIWLGSWSNGLFSFNTRTQETINFRHTHTDSVTQVARNTIRGISDRGSFLLLASLDGLWKFDKGSQRFERPICSVDSVFLFHATLRDIIERPGYDSTDTWIWTNRGLIQINENIKIVHRFNFPDELKPMSVDRDKQGVFWFATQGNGLFRYDPKNGALANIKNIPGDPHSLKSDFLMNVLVDRQQNVWVTSNLGVSVIRKKHLQFHNISITDGRLDISSVYQSKNADYVWIALKKANFQIEFKAAKLQPEAPGTLNFKTIVSPFDGIQAHDFCRGKRNFWISVYGKGIIKVPIDPKTEWIDISKMVTLAPIADNPHSLPTDQTQAIWEDPDENLWISSTDAGLIKVSSKVPYGEMGSITQFTHSDIDSGTLFNNTVINLYPETPDSLWLITVKGVDLLVNGKNIIRVFKNITDVQQMLRTTDGRLYMAAVSGLYLIKRSGSGFVRERVEALQNREIVSMMEDRQGRLWLYNTEGLMCFSLKENVVVQFNEKDGYIHKRAIQEWMMNHKTSAGWFVRSDRDGLTIFDPNSFEINREAVMPVLTNLSVNNKTVMVGAKAKSAELYSIPVDITVLKDFTVDYKNNNFSLQFSAMGMIGPEKNRYRHKLEGFDPDWIETDFRNRTATYTNLPSGTYIFRLKASNHHGIWSENERTLKVVILPPPWRTWWAYTGYSMLVAGLLVWARRNIVKQERLTASLQVAKVEQEKEHFELEKAKEVDRVKTSFFTNISHEFRTPLTLIKGPVQNLLEKYTNDPKAQEQLKLVQRNSDLLLKLINQLLDLAKLESGSLKVEKTEGDLFSFVRAIASSFESFARQKNVEVKINVPSEHVSFLFDKDKVETILINLINNAIKFTPAGGSVIVSVYLTPQPPLPRRGGATHEASDEFQSRVTLSSGEGRGEVTISVKDTGIGIPSDHQSKIFERFHQVSEAHKEVGTGIGLAFVKQLVELMGGTISLKSEVGKGSEFIVALPLELATGLKPQATGFESLNNEVETPIINHSASSLQPEASSPEESGETKPHILIVEDNTDLRHFIIDSLGSEFSYLEAENGKIGLGKATTEIPDLIISDVMMPEMDGITMTGKIKKDLRTSHIPLILLTAKSSEDSMLSGLSSGADDYLTKPFNKNELLLKVRNGVTRQSKLREKLRAELLSTAPQVHVLSEDEKFLNSVKEKILERLSDEQLSVESLAEDIGMSRVQLYRKVSGLTDISVNELIRKLRLQRAAQLLSQNWGPVSQVAYEVGFSNLSYFSKVFKEEFGVLPSEYTVKPI